MRKISALVLVVLLLLAMAPMAAEGGVVHSDDPALGLENGMGPWTVVRGDAAEVEAVSADGYVSPMWGEKMLRIGKPRSANDVQPEGKVMVEVKFLATTPFFEAAFAAASFDEFT